MRVGFDAKRAFFNNSGLGNYSRSTIELLAKEKAEHKVLCFWRTDYYLSLKIFYPYILSEIYR